MSWNPVSGAWYTAAVTSTPPPVPAAVSLQSKETTSQTNFEIDARVGWTYSVRVKAHIGDRSSAFSAARSATCGLVAPPVPVMASAACANGALTVTWRAGAGESALNRATRYRPRVYLLDPQSGSWVQSKSWTRNYLRTDPGEHTHAMVLPVPGEPPLPATGVFQVRVRSKNDAGSSGFSAPVDVTCTMPGKPGGIECAAITENRITIGWDSVPGAQGYRYGAVIRGTADVDRLEATDGDDIKNWTATTWPNPNDANQRRSSTTTVNNVTTIRRSVVHYCLESD